MTTDQPIVRTVSLTKVFKDFWLRDKVVAVQDLDLEIHPGEVFGLLGPNGSGKSTTIKMLLGLLHPTRRRISIFGRPPTDVARRPPPKVPRNARRSINPHAGRVVWRDRAGRPGGRPYTSRAGV